MSTCPACRTENPDGARFCSSCGTRLAAAPVVLEERKVITALFCDLVGFTATSEGADPEDVDRMLTAYAKMARSQIESHGGVIEKFIGDAAVGVFGVPAAHEDDPERAVRAALRIVHEAAELRSLGGSTLRLRVGINTGEAFVRLDVSPGSGERFLAGDTVNTASRIQSAAPEMGVGVGLATYEATKRRFEYEELAPAILKGKAEPVRVFHAKAPVARLGTDTTARYGGPLIGREQELATLRAQFDAAVATGSRRFAAIVGVPGLGKSRLVAELLAYVDAQPVLVTWRQGRCLPYGTGISFWALGEIVKAHAGILESDATTIAVGKLDSVLPEGPERRWFRERLLPLLGIESAAMGDRSEQFLAWRRFLDLLGEKRPTVLVFEDMHWADDAMLDFLEAFAGREEPVPILVLTTTRPELYDRRPGFPGSTENAIRIDLEPLSDAAAARLASGFLAESTLDPGLLAGILERAAGNPLFVEEFVRLLVDQDLLVAAEGRLGLRDGAALPVPESISALLAARLDALPATWKAILGDAAVVGKVFWDGAVVAMGDLDREAVVQALEGLARRELIRPAARSSMADEQEYAFWHVIAADVAYSMLPRVARATRHVAAARWIEAKASDRVEDVSDVLAHHYATAVDLARAAGDDDRATELAGSARQFLLMAAERAMGLDPRGALTLLERALVLAAPGHPDRPAVIHRYGRALLDSGQFEDAIAAFEEAIAGHLAAGDRIAAGSAMLDMADPLRYSGRPSRTLEARALLEPLGPSLPLASSLLRLAIGLAITGRLAEALEQTQEANAVLDAAPNVRPVDAARFRAGALGWQGQARAMMGDPEGLQDMRTSIAMAVEAGAGGGALGLYNNCSILLSFVEGPVAALEMVDEALAFATARGLRPNASFLEVNALHYRLDAGQLDRALREIPALESQLDAEGSMPALIEVRSTALRIAALRGSRASDRTLAAQVAAARAAADAAEEPDLLVAGLGAVALARQARGDDATTRALLAELAGLDWGEATLFGARLLPGIVRAAVAAGELGLAAQLGRNVESAMPYGRTAIAAKAATLLEARGAFEEAAEAHADVARAWDMLGVLPERGASLLGQGRSLLRAKGRRPEAAPILGDARRIFARLRAKPSTGEVDRLLAGVRHAS